MLELVFVLTRPVFGNHLSLSTQHLAVTGSRGGTQISDVIRNQIWLFPECSFFFQDMLMRFFLLFSSLSLFFFFLAVYTCRLRLWGLRSFQREIDIEIHVYRDNIIASCYHLPTNVLDLSQGLCCCLVKYIILLVTGQIINSLLGICTPKLRTPAEHQIHTPLVLLSTKQHLMEEKGFWFLTKGSLL